MWPTSRLPSISLSINYIQATIALLTGIIGFFLNLFVLFIIIKYHALHQRLMYIAVQIVAVELLYSLLVPPAIFVSGITRMWVFGDVMCNLLAMINDGFAIFRFMMTLVLALDRFISIFMPFVHQRHKKKILVILLSVVYVITLLRVILPITGIMSCYIYVSTNKICTAFSSCSTGCYYFVLVSIVVIICFGVILPFCLYMLLFVKACMVRRKMTLPKISYSPPTTDVVELKSIDTLSLDTGNLPPSSDLSDKKRQSSIITIETSRSSLNTQNRLDGIHVTITMFVLLMSVFGCTFPAFTLYFVQVITLQRSGIFFTMIMLLGRTSFNSIPVFDAIVIIRDRNFRASTVTWFKSLKCFRSS